MKEWKKSGKFKVKIRLTLLVQQVKPLGTSLEQPSVLVLHAFFAAGSTFKEASSVSAQKGNRLLPIMTQAKRNVVPFMDPPPKNREQRQAQHLWRKGTLMDVFHERIDAFEKITLIWQGEKLYVLCVDLLWKPLKEQVRFVLILAGDNKYILLSSGLE